MKNMYEEVEDIIIEMALYTVKSQEEDTIKEYKITYEDDGEIDNISITKKKDKYIIDVDGIKDELKRDNKEYFKLMLKISEVMKLSDINKINKKKLQKQINNQTLEKSSTK